MASELNQASLETVRRATAVLKMIRLAVNQKQDQMVYRTRRLLCAGCGRPEPGGIHHAGHG